MENKCVVCKTADSAVTVRVADRETSAMSNPVPLCRECLAKVSKTRKVEIVKELIPEAEKAPEHSEEEKIPLYLENVRKITSIFGTLEVFSASALILFVILLLAGFANGTYILGYISIAGIISAVLSWVFFHVLSLAAEALDDYLDVRK